MRKGNVVRIKNLRMLTNQAELLRPTTWEEKEAWRESPESKGMNSAGETKLPPQIVVIDIKADDLMVVEKARCAPMLGWSKRPGMTQVRLITGKNIGKVGFIRRDRLAVLVK